MNINLEDVSNNQDSDRVNLKRTNDKDLVQLAGYHAYNHYPVGKIEYVNGKKFEVIDTRYETTTGLDALTVQNHKTGELIVVFVGSEQPKADWIETNIKLLGDKEPAQLKADKTYSNITNYPPFYKTSTMYLVLYSCLPHKLKE